MLHAAVRPTDIIRLQRGTEGKRDVLVTDMKSTTKAKVEHRLQVAFYHLVLEKLLGQGGIDPVRIRTAIFYRGTPHPADAEEDEEQVRQREAARQRFGLDDALLEVVADPDAYLQAFEDLVTGKDSAVGVAQPHAGYGTPFPVHISPLPG